MHTTLGTPGASSDLPFHPTLRHPLTGAPLQAVGIGRRGPIWPILGGAPDEGGGSDGGGDGADTSGGSDSGQQQDKQNDGTGGTDSGQGADGKQNDGKSTEDTKPEAKDVKDFPAAAQRMIRELRKEAADNRAKASAAEESTKQQLEKIAVALGFKKGEEVDPVKLQEQLTADIAKESSRADTAEMKLAVYMAADDHGANARELFDSAAFLKEIGELDATDKAFADDLAALIKQRVKDNPTRYAREAPKTTKKSGAEHMTGGKPSERTGSLHAAVAKTMTQT